MAGGIEFLLSCGDAIAIVLAATRSNRSAKVGEARNHTAVIQRVARAAHVAKVVERSLYCPAKQGAQMKLSISVLGKAASAPGGRTELAIDCAGDSLKSTDTDFNW